VHYEAPIWDPFPHTFKVNIDTNNQVQVTVRYYGAVELEETIIGSSLEKEWIVNSGEIIDARLEYDDSASGEVKTVLWCDSWNYVALIFFSIGLLVLAFTIYKKRHSSNYFNMTPCVLQGFLYTLMCALLSKKQINYV